MIAHDCTPIRIRDAQWVFGTPGILYARYRCTQCHAEWDNVTERPKSSQIWGVKKSK